MGKQNTGINIRGRQNTRVNIMDTNVAQVTICPDAKPHQYEYNVYYNTIGIGTFFVGC